jgi:toxin ParE1/3/4
VSLPVVLTPEARQEYDNAFDYYEAQRAGLGTTFAGRIQDVLARIGKSPKMHGVVLGDIRKAVVTKFPYCVYYRELADRVEVIAVFHTSRDPADWQRRV